jgi:hypothetical protein
MAARVDRPDVQVDDSKVLLSVSLHPSERLAHCIQIGRKPTRGSTTDESVISPAKKSPVTEFYSLSERGNMVENSITGQSRSAENIPKKTPKYSIKVRRAGFSCTK